MVKIPNNVQRILDEFDQARSFELLEIRRLKSRIKTETSQDRRSIYRNRISKLERTPTIDRGCYELSAHTLIDEYRRAEERAEKEILILADRYHEISGELNILRETINRALRRLIVEGLKDTQENPIRIEKVDLMRNFKKK